MIHSGLVYVQRVANGPTGTYLTHKWIKPDQVASTDTVISGHHNLLPGHPSRPDKIRTAGDPTPVSNQIKQKTTEFYKMFKSNDEFYTHIKLLGITWKESDNLGINLMRAKMALNNAQMNGLDLNTIQHHTSNPPLESVESSNVTKSVPELADDFINSFDTPSAFCKAMRRMKIRYKYGFANKDNLAGARQSLISNMENGIDIPALWKMDTKQLYNSIPSPPSITVPPVQHSSNDPQSFDTATEVNNFFLGGDQFTSYTDDSAYGKWVTSASSTMVRDMDDKQDKTVTKLEQKMINIYTRHSRDFNHWLRGTFSAKTWGIGSWNDIPQIIHFFRRAKFMDDAIRRFEVPKPITVHRHMPCTPALLQRILNAPDGIFSDDSYMSTSCLAKMEPKLALKFKSTLQYNEVPVHLEIDVPQGKGWGMYVAHDSAYPNQCEFLLARGSQLKIVDIQQKPDGSYYVKCKLIGNTQKDVTQLKYRQFSKSLKEFITIDSQLLKAELLETKDENPWDRFVDNSIKFTPENQIDPPQHRVIWD